MEEAAFADVVPIRLDLVFLFSESILLERIAVPLYHHKFCGENDN